MAISRSAFSIDKSGFFSAFSDHQVENGESNLYVYAEQKAKDQSYSFIYNNKSLLEQEFNDLLASLKADKNHPEKFWIYSYYCSCLLEQYYEVYDQQSKAVEQSELQKKIQTHPKAEEQREYQKKIKAHFEGNPQSRPPLSLMKQLHGSVTDVVNTPKHAAKIRDQAGYFNLLRIYWIFERFLMETGLKYGRDAKILDKIDKMLGTHIDVDKLLTQFKIPAATLNELSVGFFVVRLLVNAGHMIKHTIGTEAERKAEAVDFNWKTRLRSEWVKRGPDMLDHATWGVVNFVTNYNELCHIPGPMAMWIVAGFLTVDIAQFIYLQRQAEKAYISKREDYKLEIQHYTTLKTTNGAIDEYDTHLDILNQQMTQLDIDWETKNATYHFLIGATVLLMAGFSASMLLTPAPLVMGCYFVCLAAMSMYLTNGEYSTYKQKSLKVKHAGENEDKEGLVNESKAARDEFLLKLTKNAVIPTVMMTTYAICWPAALSLTILYAGYSLVKGNASVSSAKGDSLELAGDNSSSIEEHEQGSENLYLSPATSS